VPLVFLGWLKGAEPPVSNFWTLFCRGPGWRQGRSWSDGAEPPFRNLWSLFGWGAGEASAKPPSWVSVVGRSPSFEMLGFILCRAGQAPSAPLGEIGCLSGAEPPP